VDTNVFSFLYFRKGRQHEFEDLIRGHLLCMSFASMGEALANAHRAQLGQKRKDDLIAHLRRYTILPFTSAVVESWAPMYAKLNGHLKGQGVNDLWTAACARAQPQPLPVVTDDLSDFKSISQRFPLTLIHPDVWRSAPG
jgi:predicted nucleic acid-binding protein